MKSPTLVLICLGFAIRFAHAADPAQVDQISQHGITWKFDKKHPSGQFANGDYWVAGPVNVVGITTDLHAPGFTPKPGEDGSMVNPGTDAKQGYDNRLSSYDESLNAALPGGKPVSPQNPLALPVNSSLVSMVSWLFRSPEDAEPGVPKFNDNTKAPRPVTRSGAILTVLPAAPPEGSFRPPYSGTDKTVKFRLSDLDRSKLKTLPPVAEAPSPADLAEKLRRPWIDHVNEFLGAMVHPSDNMPNYGRDMARIINDAILALNLDFAQLPSAPDKDDLLIPVVQLGIDLAGIADNAGGWPANGGHHQGRKLPILFAGALLNDDHMKSAGKWETRFQDDEQTFIVSQAEVDITQSGRWKPDPRGGTPVPYAAEDIGLAEWGIRHTKNPENDNKLWTTSYRSINNANIVAVVLNARIMGLEEAWNHPPLFAYADRIVKNENLNEGTNSPSPFVMAMWGQHPTKP
ncbi:MAG: hypothetical protein ACOYMS_09005 [Terrimicrobiaceae bacterium]